MHLYFFPPLFTCSARRQGKVEDMRVDGICAAIRVEGMLERGAEENTFFIFKNIFRAIAMVHVKIDDRHAIQMMHRECLHHTDGHIVEKTKSHGTSTFRMMPRWSHITKGLSDCTFHDQIHTISGSTRSA